MIAAEKDMILKKRLMSAARDKGICIAGFKEMRDDGIDELIDYYIHNPDWCMERDYPTLQTLKEYFCDYENKGIYVGKTFHGELFNKLQTYIFHNCKGHIKVAMNYDNPIIPMLYFANGCQIRVTCDQDNGKFPIKVPIYSFGKNDIQTHNNKSVEFIRYKSELL